MIDQSPQESYPSASDVLELLLKVERGVGIHRAVASRLERSEQPEPALSASARALIPALAVDGFVLVAPFQSELVKVIEGLELEAELGQQIKVGHARRKTLEMQLRNISQELNKGGLFRGKAKQELSQKGSRLEAQLLSLNQELKTLEDRLSISDYLLKKVAQEAASLPGFDSAVWLELDQLCLALTAPGRFLLKALSQLPAELLMGRSLAQALTTPIAT